MQLLLLVDVHVHCGDLLIIEVRAYMYFVSIYRASRLWSKKTDSNPKIS